MPWAQILLLVLGMLKDFPELVDLFNQMQQSGADAPTDAQWQALTDAVNGRTAADLRWDTLKMAYHAVHAKTYSYANGVHHATEGEPQPVAEPATTPKRRKSQHNGKSE